MTLSIHRYGEENILPFQNNTSFQELKKGAQYQRLRDALTSGGVETIQDMIHFIGQIPNRTTFGKFVDSLGIDRNELRLMKQVLNNTACLDVFRIFLDRTESIRNGKTQIPVPDGIGMVQGIDFNEIGGLVGGKHLSGYIQMRLRQRNYKNKVLGVLGLSIDIAIRRSILGSVRLMGIGRIHSLQAVEFFIKYFSSAWNTIFADIIEEYMENEENKEIAVALGFLEVILREDYAEHHHGALYASPIFAIIPNTHADELLFFLQEKGGKTSLQEIREFLRKQRQASMRLALDTNGLGLSHGANEGDFYLSKDDTVLPRLHQAAEDIFPLGGCPFAKSKLDEKTNAFIKMFEIFDEWLLQILTGLKEQGFLVLSKD